MLESFTPQNDEIISPSAVAALGNCYATKGDVEKGIDKLLEAAKIVGIPILDHIIIDCCGYFSFMENGLLPQDKL